MLNRLRKARPKHSTVVAYLALFAALGGGTATALQGRNTVKSDDIAPGAVRFSDLSKSLSFHGTDLRSNFTESAGIIAPNQPPEVIASTTLRLPDSANLVQGVVEVTNPIANKTNAQVDLQVTHDGLAHHGTFSATLPPGATMPVPVLIQCNWKPGTENLLELVVDVQGESVELAEASLSHVAFKPIPSPP